MNKNNLFTKCIAAIAFSFILASCKKNLPTDKLSLAGDMQYSQYTFTPVLGRSTLFNGIFSSGSSSLPLDFKVVNMRTFSGEEANVLTTNYPVSVWKVAYRGTEKSIEEIEAKRGIEYHPLFEVRPNSGEFMLWAEANSTMVKSQPDSGYVFDIEATNSGGRKYFESFRLRPFREREFEPSNQDPVTGLATSPSVAPSDLSNVQGTRNGQYLTRNDVSVFFRRTGDGNTLTFRFVDSLFQVIDPNKFDETDWPNLVHGFDMVKDNQKVTYQMAFPVPCTVYPTKYTTTSGAQARAVFRFSRQAFGNVQQKCYLGMNFNLYRKGDWEITFQFKNQAPKFEDD